MPRERIGVQDLGYFEKLSTPQSPASAKSEEQQPKESLDHFTTDSHFVRYTECAASNLDFRPSILGAGRDCEQLPGLRRILEALDPVQPVGTDGLELELFSIVEESCAPPTVKKHKAPPTRLSAVFTARFDSDIMK